MAPSDLPPPHDESLHPARPTESEEQGTGNEHQIHVIGLMVGTALMFIGFLNVFCPSAAALKSILCLSYLFGDWRYGPMPPSKLLTFRYGVMALQSP